MIEPRVGGGAAGMLDVDEELLRSAKARQDEPRRAYENAFLSGRAKEVSGGALRVRRIGGLISACVLVRRAAGLPGIDGTL
jgi:hypothetical protein